MERHKNHVPNHQPVDIFFIMVNPPVSPMLSPHHPGLPCLRTALRCGRPLGAAAPLPRRAPSPGLTGKLDDLSYGKLGHFYSDDHDMPRHHRNMQDKWLPGHMIRWSSSWTTSQPSATLVSPEALALVTPQALSATAAIPPLRYVRCMRHMCGETHDHRAKPRPAPQAWGGKRWWIFQHHGVYGIWKLCDDLSWTFEDLDENMRLILISWVLVHLMMFMDWWFMV